MVNMNRLATEKRTQIIGCLAEGNSIRATVRMTGAAKNTITKLLVHLGEACADYQDGVFVDLPCKVVEADEIWAFCYAKNKNVPEEFKGTPGYGDVWTFTAICADTKLVPSWLVGERTSDDAEVFRISTSYVERQNLTMRMGMRRFTRLTNGFSRKIENLSHAVSLHFMHYNFARPHKALKERYPRTPAMAAGVADHIWSLEEIAALLD
jgi:hypothetical protein